jgi:hypothetical protein
MRNTALLWWLVASLVVASAGCDDDGADADADADADVDADADADADEDGVVHVADEPGCNPLIPEVCAFPFPSMFYLAAATPTGFRAALTAEALPGDVTGAEEYLERFNRADGFSIATPWLALLPGAPIDRSSLPSVLDLAPSVTPESGVQVFDRETGERVPVWAELDLHGDTAEEQTLIVRPMRALPFGRRVAVVVTDAVLTTTGPVPEPAQAPAPFAALRDGRPTDSAVVEAMRPEYEALFSFLADHDVPRERVILAWEAVTFSEEFALSELPPAVDAALEQVAAAPPAYEIVRCFTDDADENARFGCEAQEAPDQPLSPRTWRRIQGRVTLPSLVGDDGYVRVDESGRPAPLGSVQAEFVVNVPVSLRDAPAGSAPVVVFGHGLLTNPGRYLADDLDQNGQMELAERMGAVFVGTRWTGLSDTELLAATNLIYDMGQSFTFAASLIQGFANTVAMPLFATTSLVDEPMLEASDGAGSLIDPERVLYTGISQGGIFGTTFMALSPQVLTGVLHVPGAAYSHMLGHSVDFALFQSLLEGEVADPREQQVFLALAQRLFDVGDPINYIGHVVADPLTPLGPKNCLWQCVVGDVQAVWYGCEMLMRTGGFAQAGPEVRDVVGLDLIDTPTAPGTSAAQFYDPQLGVPPLDNDTLVENGAHTSIRRNPEVQLQTVDYFDFEAPGRIVNHCGGPCVVDPVPMPEE